MDDMDNFDKNSREELKYLILWVIFGFLMMVGSLTRYELAVGINTGGIFKVILFFLITLIILGIFLVIFANHWMKNIEESFLFKLMQRPIFSFGAIGFVLVFVLLIWKFGIHLRYPFLGEKFFIAGLLLSFVSMVLILGYSLLLNLSFRSRLLSLYQTIHPFVDNHVFMGLLLVVVIGLVYRNSFEGYLLKDDDLFIVSWAREGNPWLTFVQQPEIYLRYYRPIQYILLWISYKLFAYDYAGHQAFIFIQHIIVSIVLYIFIAKVTKEKYFALISALVFGTHIYVSEIVIWTSAVVSSLGLMLVLSLFLIYRPRIKPVWYIGIGILAFISIFMHEMGLVVFFALGLFAIFSAFEKQISPQQRNMILALLIGIFVVYIVLRMRSVGFSLSGDTLSTGYFFEYHTNPRSLGTKLYIYTIVANIVANFFPIFSPVGIINVSRIFVILIGIMLSFVLYLILKGVDKRQNVLISVILILFLIFCFVLGSVAGGINFAFATSIQSMLSICVFYLFTKWKQLSTIQRIVIVFSLSLILGSSIAAFPYFRWRTHYPGVLGWAVLISMAVQFLKENIKFGKLLKVFLSLSAVIMIWGYSAELDSRLPRVTISYAKYLCQLDLPDDFVQEVVEVYDINLEEIDECQ